MLWFLLWLLIQRRRQNYRVCVRLFFLQETVVAALQATNRSRFSTVLTYLLVYVRRFIPSSFRSPADLIEWGCEYQVARRIQETK